MIRPFTCICMLMAAGSGLYLYQTKHRSQMLDREIARTVKQIDQTRDRIGVLKGEWALLSEPDRLNDLAKQHLTLKTLAPSQFVAMAELGARLPAPLPPGTAPAQPEPPAMATPTQVPIASAKPPAASVRTAERATPEKPAEKPVQVAALPPPAPATPPMRVAAKPAPALPPAAPALAPPTPRIMAPVMTVGAAPIGTRPAATAPGSIGESVARAARQREANPGLMSAAMASPQPVQASMLTPAAPAFVPLPGSALGAANRVALPPPVPYGGTR